MSTLVSWFRSFGLRLLVGLLLISNASLFVLVLDVKKSVNSTNEEVANLSALEDSMTELRVEMETNMSVLDSQLSAATVELKLSQDASIEEIDAALKRALGTIAQAQANLASQSRDIGSDVQCIKDYIRFRRQYFFC